MIETSCECGTLFSAPESGVGKPAACRKCGKPIHVACGEALSEGGGAGDFDAHLVIVSGPDRVGEQFLLGGVAEITIGKLPDRSIVLQGKKVSRGHCKLTRLDFGPSRWELHDNQSTNGLFVNDQRVLSQELKDGNVIRVGEYELKFISTFQRDQKVAKDVARTAAIAAGAAVCPSCGNVLAKNAKICVNCGVDVHSGKSLVISKGLDENDLAVRADTWIRTLSWIIPFGLFPIASEAFGTKKPIATWVIFGLTSLVSFAFLIAVNSAGDEPSASLLNLMQWNGTARNPDDIAAISAKVRERMAQKEREDPTLEHIDPAELDRYVRELVARYQAPDGVKFHWYQLFTSALLHDTRLIMPFVGHLGGNMLFLFVFGLRVNELVGNVKMAIAYIILAAGAGMTHHLATANGLTAPSLGASGAIMGLAGMYFIFFPVQRVHMAIWFRGGMFTRWQVFYKVFTMRGFWLLVLWIGLNDVIPVYFKLRDNVAHWEHLGGFVIGVLLAITLLITRQNSAHGNDILSVILGKRAWALVGRPAAQLS